VLLINDDYFGVNMFQLPPLEKYIFLGIFICSLLSAFLGFLQIRMEKVRLRSFLIAFTSLTISLAAILLIFRASHIGALPITNIFESMIFLLIFIGVTFLFLSSFMQQVWFSSVMTWVLFAIVLLAVMVVKPASTFRANAQTPWVILHALSMALSGATIVFSTAMSSLLLVSYNLLKHKQMSKLFGRMPNIERLEMLNLVGLRSTFIVMTFGLVSGIGMAVVKSVGADISFMDWLVDSMIVMTAGSWLMLMIVLVLRCILGLSGKMLARLTLVVCFLIVFAFVGTRVFCKSSHNFGSGVNGGKTVCPQHSLQNCTHKQLPEGSTE
jgi:ABC-type uncharacterized transport system permease subunit